MLLERRTVPMGDRRRIRLHYRDFLGTGELLASFTVTVIAGTVSTIDTVSISDDEKTGIFFVNAAAVKETFTATVQAVLNTTEVVTDTITFSTV